MLNFVLYPHFLLNNFPNHFHQSYNNIVPLHLNLILNFLRNNLHHHFLFQKLYHLPLYHIIQISQYQITHLTPHLMFLSHFVYLKVLLLNHQSLPLILHNLHYRKNLPHRPISHLTHLVFLLLSHLTQIFFHLTMQFYLHTPLYYHTLPQLLHRPHPCRLFGSQQFPPHIVLYYSHLTQ